MTLSHDKLELVATWTRTARPLDRIFFRSVSYTFMDPISAFSGEGAAISGGRFASVGTFAVYLSESDAVATNEVTERKKRLGGSSLITTDKYPRIVFAVRVLLKRVVDLTIRPLPKGLAGVRRKCLQDDLGPSQQFGDALIEHSVDGLLFPSQAGPGINLVVYKRNSSPEALKLENEAKLREVISLAASRR